MVNLSTKLEVSTSAGSADMKRDAKCTKWGGLEYLIVTQGQWK